MTEEEILSLQNAAEAMKVARELNYPFLESEHRQAIDAAKAAIESLLNNARVAYWQAKGPGWA